MNRTMILCLVCVGLVGFAALWYDYFLVFPIQKGAEVAGGTAGDFIQMQNSDFQEEFSDGIRRSFSPLFAPKVAPVAIFILLGVTTAVVWLTKRLVSLSDAGFGRASILLLCAAPLYVGILAQALVIKRGFRIMAEVGVTSPGSIGANFGESFSICFFGAYLSVLALVGSSVFLKKSKTTN